MTRRTFLSTLFKSASVLAVAPAILRSDEPKALRPYTEVELQNCGLTWLSNRPDPRLSRMNQMLLQELARINPYAQLIEGGVFTP